MHAMINIALRAAREAADTIIQATERPDRIKIFEKGQNDFVTDIDQAVESTLIYHIQKAYPEHSFLCEESGFTEGDDKDTVWIIDPIDGTRNFIRGLPHFCISIACLQKGKLQHAVILDPMRDDEFFATKGSGAQLNNTKIRVGKSTSLQNSVISFSTAGKENHDKSLELQNKLQGKIGGLRITGSSALDLAYVAAGRLDAGWMAGMQKWDTAAGILLVQEAGGIISDASGNPDCLNSNNLVFSNARCFKHLLKAVSE